ncbi:hypothetical protein BaOVIS_018520 [Babesia ovis]|uniref:6-Cys domain-containing protein n=1 Tax=Babesia ovis TaxID=5869 RepID=A0A9W5WV03_BABOV|nr:hypothetical protein BaOVIS_018520 [Babesia ovis]
MMILSLITSLVLVLPLGSLGDDIICNFGGRASIADFALKTCVVELRENRTVTARCPKKIGDIDYTWHPIPKAGESSEIEVYVKRRKGLNRLALSKLFITDKDETLWRIHQTWDETVISLDLARDQYFVVTEDRFLFICAPTNFHLSHRMVSHLTKNIEVADFTVVTWEKDPALTKELAKYGRGLGLLFFNRRPLNKPLHGCGSRPSPLFALPQNVEVDPDTGVRSCVVDPNLPVPIGFLCDGYFKLSVDTVQVVVDHGVQLYNILVAFKFYEALSLMVKAPAVNWLNPELGGFWLCLDSRTHNVLATIEFKPQHDYVCDISNLVMRDRAVGKPGPWCNVALIPGGSLTIKFPPDPNIALDNEQEKEVTKRLLNSESVPMYPFTTKFLPSNLSKLHIRVNNKWKDNINTVNYDDKFLGDALELDVSQAARGEVKLVYKANKPLALVNNNAISFHWHLTPLHKYTFDKIFALIQVSFVPTHPYETIGCDASDHSIFHPSSLYQECKWKEYEHIPGALHDCIISNIRSGSVLGVYCQPGETLLPDYSGHRSFDLTTGKISSWRTSVAPIPFTSVEGMRLFRFYNRPGISLANSCICVNEQGYATSQMVVVSDIEERNVLKIYPVANTEEAKQLTRYIDAVQIWSYKVFFEGKTTSFIARHEKFKIEPGKKMFFRCEYCIMNVNNDGHIVEQNRLLRELRVQWRPYDFEFRCLIKELYGGNVRLTDVRWDDILLTDPETFGVTLSIDETSNMGIEITYSKGGFLIFKNTDINGKPPPLYYICGTFPNAMTMTFVDLESVDVENNVLDEESYPRDTYKLLEMEIVPTDPYVHGCGVTFKDEPIFREDTTPWIDPVENTAGCVVDLKVNKEAGFYCPPPYVMDPPKCFQEILVDSVPTPIEEISQSLEHSHSTHFALLRTNTALVNPNESLRSDPPLQCKCLTSTGKVLSTINIVNYYAH